MLTDNKILHVFENGSIAATTIAMKHYVVANKKYMNSFRPSNFFSFIKYLGFNHQDGHASSEPTYYRGYERVKDTWMLTDVFINNYNNDIGIEHALVLYAEYPGCLKPLHEDITFLPEKN